jgi:hypothetical protein
MLTSPATRATTHPNGVNGHEDDQQRAGGPAYPLEGGIPMPGSDSINRGADGRRLQQPICDARLNHGKDHQGPP